MLELTKQQMAQMRLNGMLLALDEQLLHPPHQLSFEERLSLLVEREYLHRDNQRLVNRLKQSKLKMGATFERLDYEVPRGLNKQQLLTLASAHWVKQHRSILITGPAGTGKTFLASALAHKACLQGYSTRYYRLLHLIHDSVIAVREGRLIRYLGALSKIDVLVIDDLGMAVMNEEEKRLLLEIIENRYEVASTIIASQLPVNLWYDYINDPLIADALLDRIVHHAEKFTLTGESLRKTKKACQQEGKSE